MKAWSILLKLEHLSGAIAPKELDFPEGRGAQTLGSGLSQAKAGGFCEA